MQVNMILEQHNSFSIHEPQWVSHGTACSSVSNVNLHTKSSKWVFLHVVLLSSWTTFEAPEKKKKERNYNCCFLTKAVKFPKDWRIQPEIVAASSLHDPFMFSAYRFPCQNHIHDQKWKLCLTAASTKTFILTFGEYPYWPYWFE